MDYWWAWMVLLLVLGLALTILEIFIPSFGILGFLAISSIIAAIVVAFMESPGVGLVVLAGAIFGLPVVVVLSLRWWPRTPIGRRVLLTIPENDDVLPDSDKLRDLRRLIGQVGRAKSKMLPSGAVSINGRTIDAVSEGMPIDPGQPVRVIEVHGMTVTVQPVEEDAPRGEPQDPLSRPIDSVGPDPFEDPPA